MDIALVLIPKSGVKALFIRSENNLLLTRLGTCSDSEAFRPGNRELLVSWVRFRGLGTYLAFQGA